MLETTAGLKVPLTPPVALTMVYCLLTKLPGWNTAFTVAPPSVAVPVTLVRSALVGETSTM